jgi:hypothetical protein
MSIGRHDEPTLNALSPRNVAGWLRMRGFEYQSNYGQYGAIFVRKVDGEDCEVILPTSSQVRDFGRRMTELINDLADAEDRSPNDILTDLTLAPFDVIHVRSPDADDYGSVRLSAGLQMHEDARNLVLAAANAAASPVPRRSWRGRRFEEVSAYLDNVRLGQSQRGSFILTVLSPWDFTPESVPSLDLSETTFGRRVTRSLASALKATESAIRDSVARGAKPLADAYKDGVSWNFCQALARLAREGEGIEVAVAWSPVQPENAPVAIRLKREDASILMEAAQLLASQWEEPEVRLEGLVAAIAEAPERFDGSAVLETVFSGTVRKVRVSFGEAERLTIYDAAKEKRWIQVVGDLHRDGQRLSLLNPRDIALIEATDIESLWSGNH